MRRDRAPLVVAGCARRPAATLLAQALLQKCFHRAVVLLTIVATWGPMARAFQQPDRPALPNFDRRRDALAVRAPATVPEEKAAAIRRLHLRVPKARIDIDEVTGAPQRISAGDGFLSEAHGRGRGISVEAAAGWAENDPHRATKAFLKDYRALLGYGPEALEKTRGRRDYVTPHNGLRTAVWAQELDGIAVFEAVLISHTTKQQELVSVSSQFVADPERAANAGARPGFGRLLPTITARQAVVSAAMSLGEAIDTGDVAAMAPAAGAEQRQRFQAARFNRETATRLVWLPMNSALLRLCWQVELTSRARGETFRLLVDAHSGEVLVRRCLTVYLSDATYRVFTSDSPSPFSPAHLLPSSEQPPSIPRALVTLAALNTNASPKGWIDDGGNETRGNNVEAHLDRNADDLPDLPRPQGEPFRVFDFPLDLAQPPVTYGNAAVVQLFYWCNWMHDRLYELGFTEAAGNYQNDNLDRGGLGGDAVQADAQDGSGFDNANFTPSDDGQPPLMQMYSFAGPNPDRDADLDAEIILHEYTHGLSERLVGGGIGLNTLQSGGLAEGWSDFYALALLSESSDDPGGDYPVGGYVTYQLLGLTENYYFGIRRYPYSTNLLKNPLTFKDIDPLQISTYPGVPRNPTAGANDATEVHNQGEVWCVALWEMRANLMAKHGFTAGNQLALQLVTDGMKLTPPNPNFLQARDAILQADGVNTGGANTIELWSAFAKRGLGYSATSPSSTTTTGVEEAFDLPDDLRVAPRVEFMSRGPVSGPFTPNSQTYTLSNSGSSVLTWQAATTSLWLSASPAGGTLLPGGRAAVVTLSLNPAASLLPMGIYNDAVLFTNQASGRVHSRPLVLHVGQPDYFTERFSARDNDLSYQSFTFTPDESMTSYSVCREIAMDFPTDPADASYVALTDDDSAAVTLSDGAEVSIYGQRTNAFFIGSNGYISLGQSDREYVESLAHHFQLTRVAGLFDDLNPALGGAISWKQRNDRVAVTYANVPEFGGTGHNSSFQIELFFDGRIRLTYLSIQNLDGLVGLSRGQGLPPGFDESDFSAYGPCSPPLQVIVPATATEGSGVLVGQGQVTLTAPAVEDVEVTLASSDSSEVVVPPSVVIGTGQTQATFDLMVLDDADLDGTQMAVITAVAPGYADGSVLMAVSDDETATLSVLLPASIHEGDGTAQGMVQLSASPAADVVVKLLSSDSTEIQVPPTVMVSAGETSAVFPITIPDDAEIDGSQEVNITAHVENWMGGGATIVVLDNESLNITVVLPARAREGDGELRNASGIGLSGILPTNLVVSLSSSAPDTVGVPATLVVPAGEFAVAFNLKMGDDAEEDRDQTVTVTADAPGFNSGSSSMIVQGNDDLPICVELPFVEDWETDSLLAFWLASGTGGFRGGATTLAGPHGGTHHLILDNARDDGSSNRNELTLCLNLAHSTNVVLRFWAVNLGGSSGEAPASPFIGGADFNGLAISANGTMWYEVMSLRDIPDSYQEFVVDLDAAAATNGLTYNAGFRIRFNQYGRFAAPKEGIGIDDIAITGDRIGILSNSPALVAENCSPANGVIDPGETVTVALALFNAHLSPTVDLMATLLESGGVTSPSAPQRYGVLPPNGPGETNRYTFTATGGCGDELTATFQLRDGTNDLGTVIQKYRLGQPVVPFLELFDAVIPPLLPPGWTTGSESGAAWTTMGNSDDSPPNAAFTADYGSTNETWLLSPPLSIRTASAQLSFRHRFSTELCCDGGSLEMAAEDEPFADILEAGGSFVTNGYTGFAVNRAAWSGTSRGFITTVVNLPAAAAGQRVQFRWRFSSDSSVGGLGWFVDTIALIDGYACCEPVAPAPVLQSITQRDGRVTLTWLAIAGRTYRLQYKSVLEDVAWSEVMGDVVADSNQASHSDTPGDASQRFYRVVLLP